MRIFPLDPAAQDTSPKLGDGAKQTHPARDRTLLAPRRRRACCLDPGQRDTTIFHLIFGMARQLDHFDPSWLRDETTGRGDSRHDPILTDAAAASHPSRHRRAITAVMPQTQVRTLSLTPRVGSHTSVSAGQLPNSRRQSLADGTASHTQKREAPGARCASSPERHSRTVRCLGTCSRRARRSAGSGSAPPRSRPSRHHLVPQRAVHLPSGRLGRSLRWVQRVLHLLPDVIEARACFLRRPLLMAGGQTQQRQRAGGGQQQNSHQNLNSGEDWRNDPQHFRFPASKNICVGTI